MSCVDVPVPSSSLVHSSAPGPVLDQNGVPFQGGSRPPPGLNPLAGEFDPGRINNGARQQAGSHGRGKGGGGGRGGLSSAMRGQGSQQQQPSPARQAFGNAAVIPTAAAAPTAADSSGGATANANHLLNFQYESAAARAAGGRGGSRGGGRPGGGSRGAGGAVAAARGRYSSSKPQKYDKNKFLQANFRFLVSDAVDVSAYEADADKMFDWDDVLQVEMATAAPIQCPISLDSPPLCPQITPCGHVFSFPAIMHHLINHGGEQLRRSAPCPLCFAPVVARELRLVRVRRVVQPRAGDQLTLALIRRTRTSIIPQPVDPAAAAAAAAAEAGAAAAAAVGGGGGGQPASLFDRNPFAKFVVGGDASELWRAAAEQLAACAMELVAEGGVDAALEAPYVYGALDQLAARARRWAEHRAECLAARGLLAAREGPAAAPEALGAAAEAAVRKMFTAAVSDVTAAQEAASQRAALDQAFPSLAARPPPVATPSAAGSCGVSGDAASATSPRGAVGKRKSHSGGGGAAAAGSIAAAAPPPPAPAVEAARAAPARPPPAAAESQLSFDAVFSEDEADDQTRRNSSGGEGAAAAAAAAAAAGEQAVGLGPPPDLLHAAPPSSSPPIASAACDLAAACGPGGGGGGPSPPSAGVELLGTSPTTTRLNTPGMQGEFYTYQAADGSWVFLNPVNLRCLLHAYGSYDSCPPVITARLLELEDVVQAEAVRRRWRFLSHLPLAGAFKLCEVAMAELVPPESLAPFADELAAREKRRRRQRADERRQAAADAAAAARAAAARLGPSAEELQAMPSLSQAVGGGGAAVVGLAGSAAAGAGAAGGSGLMAAASAAAAALAREMQLSPSEVAESIALQASLEEAAAAAAAGASPGPPGGSGGAGVSFAHITKMGFAATGPALGSSPPLGSIAAAAAAPPPPPTGAWGARASTSVVGGGSGTSSAGAPAPASPWGGGAGGAAVSLAAGGAGGPWGGGKGGAAIKAAAASGAGGSAKTAGAAVEGASEGGSGAGSAAKKGKSGKGTLLFSTGNQRKY
ncbi:hypothetical protein PLESTM_000585400 [Pleodorina starrii]|nr:hypothetical protein PLESTM_000585400 [Pleodorina starrii]